MAFWLQAQWRKRNNGLMFSAKCAEYVCNVLCLIKIGLGLGTTTAGTVMQKNKWLMCSAKCAEYVCNALCITKLGLWPGTSSAGTVTQKKQWINVLSTLCWVRVQCVVHYKNWTGRWHSDCRHSDANNNQLMCWARVPCIALCIMQLDWDVELLAQ